MKIIENGRIVLCAGALVAGLGAYTSPASAAVLDTAEALYKLDFADTGSVANVADIVDSSGNGHHATTLISPAGSLLSWTTVPATGPGGSPAVGPTARGLDFAAISDPAISSPGFIANGVNTSGSRSIVTRIHWDGVVPGQNDTWIFNHAFAANDTGYLFGLQGGDLAIKILPTSGDPNNSRTSALTLNAGEWYDIALVIDDGGDGSDPANDSFTFYMQGATGGLQSETFTGVKAPLTGAGFLRVGFETTNPTKERNFDGQMDYVAVFDNALSESDITSLFSVPEPASLSLLAVGSLLVLGRKR